MNHRELMQFHGRRLVAALTVLAWACAASQAVAATQGQSPQGWAFIEGGIGQTETESMESERGKYSLWIMTASRTSGAHLADVEVTIVDGNGEAVFQRRLEGPWLMIDLPLGRYEVRSRYAQEAQSRITTIHPGDHHQIVFYFNVEAEVLPKP
ncbi:MAG: hypothetical protein ACJ8G1_29495 [Vitreoscilla sp.]